MDAKRIKELQTTLERSHPAQPVRTDVHEMRELLALASQAAEQGPQHPQGRHIGMMGIRVQAIDQDYDDVRVAAFAETEGMAEAVAETFHAAYPLARIYIGANERTFN